MNYSELCKNYYVHIFDEQISEIKKLPNAKHYLDNGWGAWASYSYAEEGLVQCKKTRRRFRMTACIGKIVFKSGKEIDEKRYKIGPEIDYVQYVRDVLNVKIKAGILPADYDVENYVKTSPSMNY
tara:strand:+ start:1793 stop:2167 length:375 start_codon:yes stop_codon:yes gene_type:complete